MPRERSIRRTPRMHGRAGTEGADQPRMHGRAGTEGADQPRMHGRAGTKSFDQPLGIHIILLAYSILALFPVLVILINAFKSRQGIFNTPLALPNSETFSLIGFQTVFQRSQFPLYLLNSIAVSFFSIFFILLLGSMAAWALSEYRFRGNQFLGIYLALGIMVPIRLGTVSLVRMFNSMGLIDTLTALIIVYTAQGLPLCIFLLRQYFSQVPRSLKDMARVEGASEYRIYRLMLPLVRPVVATIATFTLLPIWNDLWFPLILAPAENNKTIILGTRQFLGQFISDWNAVIAALLLSMVPILLIYLIFSRQLIQGLTKGALK